jgi:hypothetical protein
MKSLKNFIIVFVITIFIFTSCVSKKEKVEKIEKDGIEIIINHLEPYHIGNEAIEFSLQKEIVVPLDSEELLKVGLAEIHSFDVDSLGNIYIISLNTDGNLIYKFNQKGEFVNSFARSGQGPGEFLDCSYFRINSRNELIITANYKIITFDGNGNLLQETKIPLGTSSGTRLENGNYLFKESPRPVADSSGEMISAITLFDPEFTKIKELDHIKFPDPGTQDFKAIYYKLFWNIGNKTIITASQGRDDEIFVYDLEGNLFRIIRREHQSISPSQEYRDKYKRDLGENMYGFLKDRLFYPSSLPYFHYLITDNEDRVFIRTYEPGSQPGENICDVFNQDGVFVHRVSLKTCLSNDFLSFSSVDFVDGKMKNGRYYCHFQKEDGSTELLVYQINQSGL